MFALLMGTIANIIATIDGPNARMIRKRAVIDGERPAKPGRDKIC